MHYVGNHTEESSCALNEIPGMTNIRLGFLSQILILRKVGLPYFRALTNKHEASDCEELTVANSNHIYENT
jgi:hypothetical protein